MSFVKLLFKNCFSPKTSNRITPAREYPAVRIAEEVPLVTPKAADDSWKEFCGIPGLENAVSECRKRANAIMKCKPFQLAILDQSDYIIKCRLFEMFKIICEGGNLLADGPDDDFIIGIVVYTMIIEIRNAIHR
jgi:hypothetical protein